MSIAHPDGQPWAPTLYTRPLSRTYLSDGPRLVALLERHWRLPDEQLVRLDDWQRWLLTAALERFPLDWPVERLRGRLRYRQVVVSVGRQNGKSLLGGALGLYGLLQHVAAPSVVGIATSVEQAGVVYDRVKFAVDHDAVLLERLKPSGTRGITRRDGRGGYVLKPSKAEGLQSVPITLCVADELHLMRRSMWDSIVNGQRAQADGLVAGITTAGDDSSELLKYLYRKGEAAAADPTSRFGFWLWEAPEGSTIDDRSAVIAANPSMACGRVDIDTAIEDIRDNPEQDKQRYMLNRFVASISPWLSADKWAAVAGGGVPEPADDIVVSVHRTEGWEYAAIVVTVKDPATGRLHTELAASIPRPTIDHLVTLCGSIAGRHSVTFAVDGANLSALGKKLRDIGYPVWILSRTETAQASSSGYAKIAHRDVSHPDDELTRRQMPRAKRKNTGDGWRVVPGGTDADAVLATLWGLWVAEVKPANTVPIG